MAGLAATCSRVPEDRQDLRLSMDGLQSAPAKFKYRWTMLNISTLANPSFFMRLTDKVLPWLAAATALLMAGGLYLSFFVAPADYQQGETARIMFIHVPSAWLAMFCYLIIAISSAGSLIWRHPLADVSAKAAAPIGAAFTLLALITGSLWGKPMWGAYWVWDARLTSVLVLFFLYLGLIAIWQSIEEPSRAGRAAAILAIVGVVNLPIIKFSVDWWNTLHQPASVTRLDGPTIHPDILTPLLVMAVAFSCLFVWLHLKAMRAEILKRRVETMMMTRVSQAAVLKAAE
jgi:heme exporter protein C